VRLSVPARVVLAQFGVGVVGALVWWSVGSGRDALGALAGGSIGAASSFYLALRMGTAPATATAGSAFAGFLWGWLVKLVVAIGLLWTAARLAPDAFPALLSTFALAVMVYPFFGSSAARSD
jgi:F0F1-type ATP synthase assembly protein I